MLISNFKINLLRKRFLLWIYSNLISSNGHTHYVRVAIDRNSIYRKEIPDKCDVVELILTACMANMHLHYSFMDFKLSNNLTLVVVI